jgi:hypothetical protein
MSGWSLEISGTLIFERQHIRCSRETGWVKRARGQRRVRHLRDKIACGSKEFDPPFPVSPKGQAGAGGFPPRRGRSRGSPRKRGFKALR